MMPPRVVVIGAGIVGASVAYHLARRGARVVLMDAAEPAGGVTRQSFAWINVAHTDPHPYQDLRRAAVGEWHRLEDELAGMMRVGWCGALSWDDDPALVERMAAHHSAAGYDVRLVEREEVLRIEPGLTAPPPVAMLAPGEGALDPVSATQALVAAAQDAGAEVRPGAKVAGLVRRGDKVAGVAVGDTMVFADMVVVAAGTASAGLCETAEVALPVDASPATLIRMTAPAPLVRGIVCTPEFEVRQGADGILLAAADYIDDTPENGPMAIGHRTVDAVRAGLSGADDVRLIDAIPGWRPMPADGGPIVGPVPGVERLYTTVMHAGVILAPVIGRLAAAEIMDGHVAPELSACRLSRFHL